MQVGCDSLRQRSRLSVIRSLASNLLPETGGDEETVLGSRRRELRNAYG